MFDIIIIGAGAGGGTLLDTLKNSGKNILVLERGSFLPKEKGNWDTIEVFQKDRYHNAEEFIDDKGKEFKPGMGYWVDGNTKVYDAALFRLREKDFELYSMQAGYRLSGRLHTMTSNLIIPVQKNYTMCMAKKAWIHPNLL